MIGVIIAAWYDIRRRPLRTLAGIGGMVAAVTALITIDASGVLSRSAAEGYFRRHYGQPATLEVRLSGSGGAVAVSPVQTALISGLGQNGIHTVSPIQRGAGVLLLGDQSVHVDLMQVSPAYPSIRLVDLESGAFPRRTANGISAHVVISADLASRFGLAPDQAVGRSLDLVWSGTDSNPDTRLLPAEHVTVDAVMSEAASATSGANVLVVSDGQPQALDATTSWLVRVAVRDVPLARQTVGSVGREFADDGTQLQVRRIDEDEQLEPIMNQQARTSTTVAWVAMLVGGFGLLGIGLASIRERSRELGIRRALGATRLTIFAGMVIETLFSALVAVLIAVVVAVVCVRELSRHLIIATLPLPPHPNLPIESAMRGLLAAVAVGLVAALLPAMRAIKLAVAEAVRN